MSAAWPARMLVVAPQVWSREGGVQRYGRSLMEALASLRPKARLELCTLLDQPGPWPRARLIGAALACVGWRPQLVICTHRDLAPLAWLVARLSGARLWVVAHGMEVWAPLRGLRRWSLSRAQRLLPVSRHTASRLTAQLGAASPPCSVLPNTYDAAQFSPGEPAAALRERYGLRRGQPLIFSLTRLSAGDRAKHLDRLIGAMPELLRSHADAVLLIGGDGDDRPRLQALVRRLGLEGSVLLPGRIADAELPDHYRLARVFALPSDKEGFGIVFLEALGCGCPVLAGNRDGSRDPLADGRFGLLVNPDEALAPPLRQLLEQRGDPLWFCPDALSRAVAERFAFPAFRRALDALLLAEPHP